MMMSNDNWYALLLAGVGAGHPHAAATAAALQAGGLLCGTLAPTYLLVPMQPALVWS
jgi:hypothetical protein